MSIEELRRSKVSRHASGALLRALKLGHILLAFVTVAVCGALVTTGAQAQAAGPPPPVFQTIDARGVNVVTGQFQHSSVDLSIGPPQAGLAFGRTRFGSEWVHSFEGRIQCIAGCAVSIGDRTETFTPSGGAFTSDQAEGSTLSFNAATGIYTYTTSTGEEALFSTAFPIGGLASITQLTMPNGQRTTFHYKSATVSGGGGQQHRLQSVTNNHGYQLHFEYAANGPTFVNNWQTLVRVTGINNAVVYCNPLADSCGLSGWPTVAYARSGITETVTDALGRVTRITYDVPDFGGLIIAVRRPSNVSSDHINIIYSGGRVLDVMISGVGVWRYLYADNGAERTTTIQAPLSRTTTLVSDLASSRLLRQTDPLNRTTAYQYDANSRLRRVTWPEGNAVQYSYDVRGNITEWRNIAKPSAGLADIVTSATYPATCTSANFRICNKPVTTTDARGFVTDYTYAPSHGGTTQITLPDPDGAGPLVRPQSRFTYQSLFAFYRNSANQIVQAPTSVTLLTQISSCATLAACANGADETRRVLGYGAVNVANNRLPLTETVRSGTNALSVTTTYTYDSVGNLLTIDGPLSGTADTARMRYDLARQMVGLIGPDPDGGGALFHRAERYSYNLDGQPITVERGTVASQSDSDWAAFNTLERATVAYDFAGRPIEARVFNGAVPQSVTQTSYDAAGRTDCEALRMNPGEFSSLPASACVASAMGSDGPDRILRYSYNAADEITQLTTGFGSGSPINEVTSTYTLNGQQAAVADGRGNLTTFLYDGFDRVAELRFPSAANGAVSSSTDRETYAYDAASNITTMTLRDGQQFGLNYDNLNRLTFKNGPDANGSNDITYAYDNFGRQTAIGNLTFSYDQLSRLTSAGAPLGAVSYQYDASGRRTRITWPDGFFATYSYDLTDAVTAIRENGAASGAGVLATYNYDNLGRRTQVSRAGGSGATTTYAFGAPGRMTNLAVDLAATNRDYSAAFSYNSGNEIVQRVGSNAAYDTPAPAAGATSYVANGLNQYANVSGANFTYDGRGNVTSTGTAAYAYDSHNRLTSAGAATLAYDPAGRLRETISASVTTRFLYDGDQVIAEYNGSGALLRRYVPGPGIDEPVVWYEGPGAGDRRWLLADERGSVIAIADAQGTSLAVNAYDEFGVPGAANVGRFQYTGQMWLPEAGLYHYRSRAYAPSLGRFLQADPILFGGGMNLYAYVGNNPINFTDPMGLQGDVIVVPGVRPRPAESGGGPSAGANLGNGSPFGTISGDPPEEIIEVSISFNDFCARFGGNSILCQRRRFEESVDAGYWDNFGQLGSIFVFGSPDPDWSNPFTYAALAPTGRLLRFNPCGCFEEGTLVATPDGLRPIEDIAIGDLVLAYNPETSDTSAQAVTALIRPEPKALWRLEVRDADGETEVFFVTDDHPWFIEEVGWVETAALARGQRIETADDRGLTILDIAITDRIERTYNLTVAGPHTFLVGEDGAVVHNICNQMMQQILRGQAPRGVTRVDRGRIFGEQDHLHINGGALNRDGTWKHLPESPLTRAQEEWLRGWGWGLPG